jgi:O-antigen/teichoic acid export membrane protein
MPEGLGKVNFAQSIVSYFVMLAGLGVGTHGIRECAKVRNDRNELSKLASELFTINVVSTIIAYLLFLVALFAVLKFETYRKLLCVSSATILFSTLGIEWLYGALEEYRYITVRSIAFQFVSLVLLFILVKTEEDYIRYAGISVLSSAGSNILNFIHARKFIELRITFKKDLIRHLKPILILFSMALTVSVYTTLDTTMIGFIAGDSSVGIYTTATKLVKITLSMITAASVVLLPRLSYYVEQGNFERFLGLIQSGFNFLLCLSIPAGLGLCLLSKPLVLLFSGANYIPAIPVMQIMTPIILTIAIGNLVGIQLLMPLGKERLTLFSVMGGAVTNFSLNLVLIPALGAFGAGIATVCAETIVTMILLILVREYLNFKEILINLLQVAIASICMAFSVIGIQMLLSEIILQISISIIAGAAVYIGCLLLTNNKYVYLLFRIITKRSYIL